MCDYVVKTYNKISSSSSSSSTGSSSIVVAAAAAVFASQPIPRKFLIQKAVDFTPESLPARLIRSTYSR
jgi:hypothetical protein